MNCVSTGHEMTSVDFGSVVLLAAGDAVTVTVLISFSPAYIFAEPFIDFFLCLCMVKWFLLAWFLAQLLAGLAVRLGAPLWHASIIRRESLPPMPRVLPCLS